MKTFKYLGESITSLTTFLVIFTFGACATKMHSQFNPIHKNVLERELSKYELKRQDTLYLQLGLEKYLLSFLDDNVVEEDDDLEFHNFRSQISENEQRELFNKDEIKYLKSQLGIIRDEFIFLLELPDRMEQMCKTYDKVKKNYEQGLTLDAGIDKILISKPLISKNEDFVIFALYTGYQKSMTGGIKMYKKTESGYRLYAAF